MISSAIWRRPIGRLIVGGLCAAALGLQAGCYTYQPLQTSVPAAGRRIAVALNDRGRVTVSDRLGSSIDVVDGLLVAADESSVSLDVYRTTDLRGATASWTGERVQLAKDGIAGYQLRQFSRARTYLLVGAVTGLVVATMLFANLSVFGRASPDSPGDGGGTGESR